MFTYGVDAEDYLKEVIKEQSIGGNISYGLFSATLKVTNSSHNKNSFYSKNSYASCDVIKNRKRLYVSADPSFLLSYRNPEFINDVNNLPPMAVIERYGTHVLTDFNIGGRLNFIFKSEIYNTEDYSQKKLKIEAGLKATILKIGIGVDGSMSHETIEQLKNDNTNKNLHIEYYGGEGTGASYNLETGTPTVNVHQWEASVTDRNAALTSIDWSKAYPIYEFVTDPSQKAVLKNACETYINSKKVNLEKVIPFYEGSQYTRDRFGNITGFSDREIRYWTQEYFDDPMCNDDLSQYTAKVELLGYLFKEQKFGTVPVFLYGYYKSHILPPFYSNLVCTTNPTPPSSRRGGEASRIAVLGYAFTSPQENTKRILLKPVNEVLYVN